MPRPPLDRKTLLGALAAVLLTATAGASAIAVNAGLLGTDPAPEPFDAVPAASRDDMSATTVTAPSTSIITIDEIVYENGAPVTAVDGATVTTPTVPGAAPSSPAPTRPSAGVADDDDDDDGRTYDDDDDDYYEDDDDEYEDERDD